MRIKLPNQCALFAALVPIKISNNNRHANYVLRAQRIKHRLLHYAHHVLLVLLLLSMDRHRHSAPHVWLGLCKYYRVNHRAHYAVRVVILAVLAASIVRHALLAVMRMALALLNAPIALVAPIKRVPVNHRAVHVLPAHSIRPLV